MSTPVFDHADDLDRRIAAAAHLLVMLDYDGTLSPIVSRPKDAHLSPQVRQRLQVLASRGGVSLAVVSGRNLSDVQARVGLPGLIYAGNHGLEVSGPGFSFVEPTARSRQAALQALCEALTTQIAAVDGAWIENKGLTATVHFRAVASESVDQLRRVVRAAISNHGRLFHLTSGHSVCEIRPQVNWNKGQAAKWIRGQLEPPAELTIYLGDDATDEDAFRALGDGITIRVGNLPDTFARYHLRSSEEVPRLLSWLASLRSSDRRLERT